MSGLLLDTHVWLWYAEGVPDRVSPETLSAIDQARRQRRLFVSAISVWEIGLLVAKGRIGLSAPPRDWMTRPSPCPVCACGHSTRIPHWRAPNFPASCTAILPTAS